MTRISIRDEYSPRFGRQVLTLWSGSFASAYDGEAVELPRHDGYMLTMLDGTGPRVRVNCAAPRTEDNWQLVDATLSATAESWYEDQGYVTLGQGRQS